MKVCVFVIIGLLAGSATAETLNEWLGEQVRSDVQVLAKTVSQTDGYTLPSLKDSRTYVPFFLEAPHGFAFQSAKQKSFFDAWINDIHPGFLPGGYVYRLRFVDAPPLYATSAGEWDGTTWRSLELEKDLLIENSHVWSGSEGQYLYVTILSGRPPRLILYDKRGEIIQEEKFDANAPDFEQRFNAALKRYPQSAKPVLEMISLAEYLKSADAPWRRVDTSGEFNLRNQQQRPNEKEWLTQAGQLTRNKAINLLQSQALQQDMTVAFQPSPVPPAPQPVQQPKLAKSPTSTEEGKFSAGFPTILIAILVGVVVAVVVFLMRRKSI